MIVTQQPFQNLRQVLSDCYLMIYSSFIWSGFIDFILQPSFDLLSETLELIIENIAPEREKENIRVWNLHLNENWKRWNKQSKSKTKQ